MGISRENENKLYVLDTNVLLHEPFAFLSFQEHQVVIPMTVLEELDHIKDRKKDVSRDARIAIRALDDILRDATPEQMLAGVDLNSVNKNTQGTLTIVNDHLFDDEVSGLPGNENDHRIINTAIHLQKEKPSFKVVLVTKDINMRLKAKGAGLEFVEDYRTDQLIDDISLLSSGYKKLDGDFWQQVKECHSEQDGRDTYHIVPKELVPDAFMNEYLLDETGHFAARVVGYDDEHIKLLDLGYERIMARNAWGVSPKNVYQAMALNALLDPHMDLVILTGPAGCGKTLLALACALELVIERGLYDKVIVTRNTPEIAESIGYLPGTEDFLNYSSCQKDVMLPYLAA